MAATLQHNITTTLTHDLLTVGDNINNVKRMSNANVDSSIQVDNGSTTAVPVDVIISR